VFHLPRGAESSLAAQHRHSRPGLCHARAGVQRPRSEPVEPAGSSPLLSASGLRAVEEDALQRLGDELVDQRRRGLAVYEVPAPGRVGHVHERSLVEIVGFQRSKKADLETLDGADPEPGKQVQGRRGRRPVRGGGGRCGERRSAPRRSPTTGGAEGATLRT
jgi:hypothetical protein